MPAGLAAQTAQGQEGETSSNSSLTPGAEGPTEAAKDAGGVGGVGDAEVRDPEEGAPVQPLPPPAFYAEPLEPPMPTDASQRAPDAAHPSASTAPLPIRRSEKRVRLVVPEPPPPPVPRHRAPKTSLVAGLRLGYWLPFGDLWGRCVAADAYGCTHVQSVPFRDYAGQGPMFELDLGARLARHYTLYALFEHARLGPASGEPLTPAGAQSEAETDYFALGFRVSTNPNSAGLLLDLAIGARRFRTVWDNGAELRLSDAPFESRLGIGADVRLSRAFSLSPMFTVGVGSFAQADWVDTDDTIREAAPEGASRMTHGWLTLQLGAHFDLLARR